MWRLEQPAPFALPDVDRFIDLVNTHHDFFVADVPITIARAPGRLDLMGGIADYSGSLVLELPLQAATLVAAQVVAEPCCAIWSLGAGEIGAEQRVNLPLEALAPVDGPLTYAAAHALLTADEHKSWAAYVAGVVVVLQRERGIPFYRGLRLLINSDVPAGKGISSSAALEVATMQAICGAYGVQLEGRDLAIMCQQVENLVVGAPCGVMDQMTSACGEQDRLLALLCQPAELEASVALPDDVEVWGIDSGIRHAVGGADYGSVRVGAFMGYRIIAELSGLAATPDEHKRVSIDDPQWRGFLANIAPSHWETAFRDHVPETLDGATFLAHYGGLTDTVTEVDPARTYPVRAATAHPIYEHFRVRSFRSLLQHQPLSTEHLVLLGELMFQSHWSYSACGLGSDGTDRLVELVRAVGADAGLFGAKITGGGSGGTVAILARRGAGAAVQQIADAYAQETGRAAPILAGSSPGAIQFGTLRLVKE